MKWPRTAFAGVLLLTLALLVINGSAKSPGEKKTKADESRIRIGFAIAPVHLNLEKKNRALVGLGSYIVNAQAVCADCHSCPTYAPGHNPYLGESKQFNGDNYLAGGVPFGPFTSRNITPEADGELEFTLDQFKLIMRTGIDLEEKHPEFGPLLQVMPWPIFQSMNDHDLEAIYEYLSSIPHAEPGSCTGPGQ